MARQNRHIIGRQILDLKLPKRAEAFAMQQKIAKLYWEKLAPAIETILDQLVDSEELIQIDQLEIDLGHLDAQHLESQLEERIKEALEKAIKQKIKDLPKGVSSQHIRLGLFEQWLFFLEKGYLPWNSSLELSPAEWETRIIETLAINSAALEQLSRLITSNVQVKKRILQQSQEAFLVQLMGVFTGKPQVNLLEFKVELYQLIARMHRAYPTQKVFNQKTQRQLPFEQILREKPFNQLFWNQMMTLVIEKREKGDWQQLAVKLTEGWLHPGFLKLSIQELKVQSKEVKTPNLLLAILKSIEEKLPDPKASELLVGEKITTQSEQTEHPREASNDDTVDSDKELPKNITAQVDQSKELPVTESTTELTKPTVSKEQHNAHRDDDEVLESELDENLKNLPEDKIKAKHLTLKKEDKEVEKRTLSNKKDVDQSGALKKAEASPNTKKEEGPPIAKTEQPDEPQQLEQGGVERKERSRKPEIEGGQDSVFDENMEIPTAERPALQQLPDVPKGSYLYVENAGVIILHPFLSAYFKEFDLLEEGQFRNELAQHRAVHLIQFLATGVEGQPEYELLLPKFLCAMPFDHALESNIDLSDTEKEEAEHLLKTVISHWSVLKNTSPAGLREGFLQRDGKLEKRQNGWYLIVEQKTLDILLDKLPWGLSMVKLPWMTEFLRVEWV